MAMKKVIITLSVLLVIFIAVISMVSSVYAITASIGNARMVLRANVGDTIERAVLVKNVNNVTVKVSSFASGDLAQDMILKDANFTLEANQEKNIDFKVKIAKNGTTETKINIAFSPTDGKSGGVGLSSTIIVIAGGESADDSSAVNGDDGPIFDFFNNFKINMAVIGIIATAIVFAVFVVVLVLYSKKGLKKDLNKEMKLNKPSKS